MMGVITIGCIESGLLLPLRFLGLNGTPSVTGCSLDALSSGLTC